MAICEIASKHRGVRVVVAALLAVVFAQRNVGATVITIKIEAAKKARPEGLVKSVVLIPKEFEKTTTVYFDYDAPAIHREPKLALGQLIAPSLSAKTPESSEDMVARELVVLEPGQVADGPAVTLVAKLGSTKRLVDRLGEEDTKKLLRDVEQFSYTWHDRPGKSTELRMNRQPVLRYMYEAVDNSTKERRGETYKIYHHVFDPEGDRLLTKGPGGLFPHHRGLFYGFNKISYGDKQQADVWHCNNGEWQAHVKVISQDAGPLVARQCVAVDWHGRDGRVFAKEERELTVHSGLTGLAGLTPEGNEGRFIDFTSKLTSTVGPLKLDGDPQHAGFQFRASQEVPDKTAKETYYLRPDGKGEPGKFRNWPQDKGHENLPWNALSFVIEGQRYTVVYLDHPKNPKPARYSERDYGRFGSYFVAELDEGKPLTVQYRVWVQRGEMTVEQCEALSKAFVEPVKVEAEVK